MFYAGPAGVMLERDDAYPPEAEPTAELDAIAATLAGPPRRLVVTVRAPGPGERWLSVPPG